MHSSTRAFASFVAATLTIRTCSITLAPAGRNTGYSEPSGKTMLASVPVVFAQVGMPPSRSPAATSRVTLDLPRVPLT